MKRVAAVVLSLMLLSMPLGATTPSEDLLSGKMVMHKHVLADVTGSDFTGDVTSTSGATTLTEWSGGNVIYVPLTGDIETYLTNATAGDTLVLAAGTYAITADIDVSKAVNIVGQGSGSGGTIISCEGDVKNNFDISASNVRISDLAISSVGHTCSGITTTNNLTGILLENISIVMDGYFNTGVFIGGSNATIRNLDLTMSSVSSVSGPVGIHTYSSSFTTQNSAVYCYNCHVSLTSEGGAGSCIAYYVQNVNNADTLSMYLYDCYGKSTGGTTDTGITVASTTTYKARAYAYNSIFDGGSYDVNLVDGPSGNVCQLSGCTLAHNTISGAVDFGTNDAWSAWTPTINWTTGTPTVSSSIWRYKVDNGKCFFTGLVATTDGAGATAVTFTLPITPKDNNTYYPIQMSEKYNATSFAVLTCLIDASTPSATVSDIFGFQPMTDDAASGIYVSGFYEV